MKIDILTIWDLNNYGNRLQNYAVQEILRPYGDVKTIIRYYFAEKHGSLMLRAILLRRNIKKVLEKETMLKRFNAFSHFSKQYIHTEKLIVTRKFKGIPKAAYYVTGSDQVWNPYSCGCGMCVNMLGFASAEKKIAVAPSISVDSLTSEQEAEFKKYLSDFKALSCREQQGADLITQITGRECTALIDPTLMLSAEEWNKVSKKPKFHNEDKKYILLYFLGNLTPEYQQIIEKISKKYGLEIINIYDKKSKYFSCGPSEFIWMVKHCEMMLTDSFHGSVFSYIYDRPFRIFKRAGGESMNSRLTNLMDKLHLDDSVYLNENDSLDNILDVHYDKTYLYEEQKKFRNYLDKAFDK